MHVVATAGHVDHGKSTLVRALTGADPDRLAEERRRGLTIELGYAWFTLPSGRDVAFVDVPGHERFLATMLAGVGPVPVALLVVAADGGWMPQTEEHVAALDALNVRHGVLVVTRSDLTGPEPVLTDAREWLAGSSLEHIPAVAVSARTGQGMSDLVTVLDEVTAGLPRPDVDAPVRLWIDRAFTAKGSGVVVTGTLNEGRIDVGDLLDAQPLGQPVKVRGLQTLKQQVTSASSVSRVAVNLRGVTRPALPRGTALTTPGRWTNTNAADVRLEPLRDDELDVPAEAVLHIGAAHVVVRVRELNREGKRAAARLRLRESLPLHVGDVALLRDPGQPRGSTRIVARAVVLDVAPRPLRRRGDAARLGTELLAVDGVPDASTVLARHGVLRRDDLVAMGLPPHQPPAVGQWLVDATHRAECVERLVSLVKRYDVEHPLEPGMPAEAARRALRLPDRRIVDWLVAPPLRVVDGRITSHAGRPSLTDPLERAVARLETTLASSPFRAPEHDELASLGLDHRALGAAAKAGRLLRISDGVVLLPDAEQSALAVLRVLPQPFTVTEARQALNTTRRVAIPLLELLDRNGHTERVDEHRRRVR